MRYTEARLESISEHLLVELKKKTVGMRPNYDGQFFEPVVLPAQLPHLLLNGATGIAVGMATNIPPHNLREVIKACVRLVDEPDLSTSQLMRFVQGPDFPTGGRLLNNDEELEAMYETGSGSLKVVGEWTQEAGERGERFVVITSVPFNVNKAQLVEKIADCIRTGKLPQLVDVRDESTDEIRVVLELAPKASADAAMAYLFKNTPLQSRFHVNMTCLVPSGAPRGEDGELPLVPARVSLKEILRHFLDFRLEVVTRRLRFDLEQLERRIHLLEAFEAIFGALDEALELIRTSSGKSDAADRLMKRFSLDEVQAEAILEAKLYRIARMEIEAVRTELREKRAEAAGLRDLLSSDASLWDMIKEELREVARKHGDKRRTAIGEAEAVPTFNAEDYIVREDAVVVITRDGWMRRQRSYSDITKLRVRDNDEVGWVFRVMTHRTVVLLTSHGQAYTMRADGIPATSGYGEPVQAHFDFADGEKIIGVSCSDPRCSPWATEAHWEQIEGAAAAPKLPQTQLVALTRAGNAVRFGLKPYRKPSTRAGRMFIKLKEETPDGQPDAVVAAVVTVGNENVCLATVRGRALIFPISDVPEVKGRGRGVSAIALEGEDSVLAFCLSTQRLEGLEVETNRGRKEIVRSTKFPVTRRGRKGQPIVLRGFLVPVAQPPLEIKPPYPLSTSSGLTSTAISARAPRSTSAAVAEGGDEGSEAPPTPRQRAEAAMAARRAEVVYNDVEGPDGEPPGEGEDEQIKLF